MLTLDLPRLSIIVVGLSVWGRFVNISRTLCLAEEPARRSCLVQVVGRVANPRLAGGQVAVLRPCVAIATQQLHTTPGSKSRYMGQMPRLANLLATFREHLPSKRWRAAR
jgi:hypothetical protein